MNREHRIKKLLQDVPFVIFELKNDSAKHAGHVEHLGGAGFTGETHYKLLMVSEQFVNLSRVERHQLVMGKLADEFKNGLHALELKLYAPIEYKA